MSVQQENSGTKCRVSFSKQGRPLWRELNSVESETNLNTVELLKKWPLVGYVLSKGEEMYSRAKSANKFFHWVFSILEGRVKSLASTSKSLAVLCRPMVNFVDSRLVAGLEKIEKHFPLVKESPKKVYDTIKQRLRGISKPVIKKTSATANTGKSRVEGAVRTTVDVSRKTIEIVKSSLDRIDNSFKDTKSKASQTEEPDSSSPATEPQGTGRLPAVRGALVGVAGRVVRLHLGAGRWAVRKLPLVGALLATDTDGGASEAETTSDEPTASS